MIWDRKRVKWLNSAEGTEQNELELSEERIHLTYHHNRWSTYNILLGWYWSHPFERVEFLVFLVNGSIICICYCLSSTAVSLSKTHDPHSIRHQVSCKFLPCTTNESLFSSLCLLEIFTPCFTVRTHNLYYSLYTTRVCFISTPNLHSEITYVAAYNFEGYINFY